MDVAKFLEAIKSDDAYRNQIVFLKRVPPREARYKDTREPISSELGVMLSCVGIDKLYSHQAEAIDAIREGKDVVLATGTASGKTLCYQIPVLEDLLSSSTGRSIFLYPTKALAQDQLRGLQRILDVRPDMPIRAGTFDGDTPAPLRRKLRDSGNVIFTNPDMLHAAVLPQHSRWGRFFADLRFIVVDEIHTYCGLFGSNVANVFRRLERICGHYGVRPQIICCSATIGNPQELAEKVTGRKMQLIDRDGSPRGVKTYIFWNPPKIKKGTWRSRRSANVEAHELMAKLVANHVPTITFSKARVTAELIYKYVREELAKIGPNLSDRIAPYRSGYRPEERREIEKNLFSGNLLGVSTTRALELGIDVSGLEACIIVGYPGTIAATLQQAGRAGRTEAESLVILLAVDTAINQYVMRRPEYIFGRPIENGVLEPDNPYLITGHLRCATAELPVKECELDKFGPMALGALEALEEKHKIRRIDGAWYHASTESPTKEVSLRNYCEANVIIVDTGNEDSASVDEYTVVGEVDKLGAQPLVHTGAIYMHHGETYLVDKLDLDRNLALVKKVNVDYYTHPMGGTDVHHIDNQLREKPFKSGVACFGEVTATFQTYAYQKIRFYTLDVISEHPVDLPPNMLETMGFWIIPPESLMMKVLSAGFDVGAGLRGIGYATRMALPLFVTCETLDFSHSIGCNNSPWHTIFVYERYPRGLGFTEKAYDMIDDVMEAVFAQIKECDCKVGCPCCVGKPLRQFTTWNIELGEGNIPSKPAAIMILQGLLRGEDSVEIPTEFRKVTEDDLDGADDQQVSVEDAASAEKSPPKMPTYLERGLRRRMERMRNAVVWHDIQSNPPKDYPKPESPDTVPLPDPVARISHKLQVEREKETKAAKRPERPETPSPEGRRVGRAAEAAPSKTALKLGSSPARETAEAPSQAEPSLSAQESKSKKRDQADIAAEARRRLQKIKKKDRH